MIFRSIVETLGHLEIFTKTSIQFGKLDCLPGYYWLDLRDSTQEFGPFETLNALMQDYTAKLKPTKMAFNKADSYMTKYNKCLEHQKESKAKVLEFKMPKADLIQVDFKNKKRVSNPL